MRLAALCAAASLMGCGTGSTPSGATQSSSSTSGGPYDGGPLRTIPLTGCAFSNFFASVTVGGQPFTMILDTGSTDTAVALSTCATCGVSPTFSPPSGSCSLKPSMPNRLGFAGGVCSETVSVGGELPDVTMNVVGIETNQEFFTHVDCTQQPLPSGQPQYQGILGLGPPVLDSIGHASDDAYFSALVASGVTNEFGLLLCSVGGRAWFGGYDTKLAEGPPQYTPLSAPTGWSISVSSIGLGSTSLGAGAQQTIVDTGTLFYSMPQPAYESFINRVAAGFETIFGSSTIGSDFGKKACVAPVGGQTRAQIDAALPPMTLTLPSSDGGSFTLSYPATASYLVPATPAEGGALQYCMAIKDAAATGGYSILGGSMLRAYITLFDLADSRLGFIPQRFCS